MKRAVWLLVAASLYLIAVGWPAEDKPLATRVDHFYVESEKAQPLFTFFKETFQLPESWPFRDARTHASGGLWLGNTILEFVRFPDKSDKPAKTELRGIAFEPSGGADETAAELTQRGISRGEVENRMGRGSDGQMRVTWSLLDLKGFPPAEASILFVDYKFRRSVATRNKARDEEFEARKRGPLRIVGVAEITVGVQDLEEARGKWSALLAPSPRISDDAFVFESGPRIRLVRTEAPGIQGIVLTVRSLDGAEELLKERQLLAKDDAGNIYISPAAIDGLSIRLVAAASEQEKSAGEDFIFKTEVHVDVLLHLLAHLDIGKDDASLYSEEYIKNIAAEKQKLGLKADLKDEMDSIKDVFISDSGLRYIDFLPFYVADYEDLINSMRWLATETNEKSRNEALNRFRKSFSSSQKQRDFMSEFSRILDHEYQTFYRDYWQKEQARLATVKGQFEEFVAQNWRKVLSAVMKKEQKNAAIFFCLSMTRYGRGFSSRDRFGAAVKLPEKREEFLPNFIMAIHEMTHQFSDALVMKAEGMDRSQSDTAAGSEGYRIHLASEYGVIYAEYLLFRKYLPEYLNDYCLFFLDAFGKGVKDRSPEELDKAFRAIIDLSDKSIASIADYIDRL